MMKIGDIVTLKSSGPEMTVIRIRDDGKLECAWFAGEKYDKVESYYFPPDSLRLAEGSES